MFVELHSVACRIVDWSFSFRQTNYNVVSFFTVPLGKNRKKKKIQLLNKLPWVTIVVSAEILFIIIVRIVLVL